MIKVYATAYLNSTLMMEQANNAINVISHAKLVQKNPILAVIVAILAFICV